MNTSEQKAYKWLQEQGIPPDEIEFNARKTPDFKISDGRGFEVKRLYKDKILIRADQFRRLKQMPETTILVMADDKDEPVAQIPTSKLKPAIIIEDVLIHVILAMKFIGLSDSVKKQLDALKDRDSHTSFDSLIRALMSTPCKGTICVWYWNCMEYGCPKFQAKEES